MVNEEGEDVHDQQDADEVMATVTEKELGRSGNRCATENDRDRGSSLDQLQRRMERAGRGDWIDNDHGYC